MPSPQAAITAQQGSGFAKVLRRLVKKHRNKKVFALYGNKKQEVNLLKHVMNNGREKVYLLKWYSGSLGDDNQIVHVRVKVRIC